MRILIFADFHSDRLGASYLRAMKCLGHEVYPFNMIDERRNLAMWLRSRLGHRLTIRSRRARQLGASRFNARLRQAVAEFQPHLVFILNGDFIMPESLREAKATGAKVVIFHPDNPLPPNYANRPETLALAAESDYYLVWGDALLQRLETLGIAQARFMPFAWDPLVFPFQKHPAIQEFDVIFIGGWDPTRETVLNEVAKYFDLKLWGPPYWRTRTSRSSLVRRCWQGSELDGKQAAEVISRARVTLNIVRRQHIIGGQADGVIMRNFEVPGAGGFLLSTWTPTADRLFPEAECGAYFADLADCLKRIEYFLTHADQRDHISRRAHNEVSKRHLYTHRVKELEALLA